MTLSNKEAPLEHMFNSEIHLLTTYLHRNLKILCCFPSFRSSPTSTRASSTSWTRMRGSRARSARTAPPASRPRSSTTSTATWPSTTSSRCTAPSRRAPRARSTSGPTKSSGITGSCTREGTRGSWRLATLRGEMGKVLSS